MWTKYLNIEGMSSPNDASSLEEALERFEGVELNVLYKERLGVLEVSSDVSLETLNRCIEDQGYKVEVMDDKATKQSIDPSLFPFVLCAITCPLILIFISLGGMGALMSMMAASPIYVMGFVLIIAGIVFYLIGTRSKRLSRGHKGGTLKA